MRLKKKIIALCDWFFQARLTRRVKPCLEADSGYHTCTYVSNTIVCVFCTINTSICEMSRRKSPPICKVRTDNVQTVPSLIPDLSSRFYHFSHYRWLAQGVLSGAMLSLTSGALRLNVCVWERPICMCVITN